MTDLATLLFYGDVVFNTGGIAYFLWLSAFSSYIRPLNREAWANTKRRMRGKPMVFEDGPTVVLTPELLKLAEEWARK